MLSFSRKSEIMNNAGSQYKKSFYNHFFKIDGAIILFNAYRGNLIEISDDLQLDILENRLDEIPSSAQRDLLDLGFLIHADSDEVSQYLQEYQESKEKIGELWVKLFLATSCNLGCPYCYQGAPKKSGNVITSEAIERLIKWLHFECTSGLTTVLNLEFYGGEPLLASSHLPNLIESINNICKSHGVFVNYSIVTNGTLLNTELIDLFISNNVTMQITLDGDKATHDSRRAWKTTGNGTFNEIFSNIESICSRGGEKLVRLRMNVDQGNIREVSILASRAKDLGVSSFVCGRIHFREKKSKYENHIIATDEFEENFDLQIYRALQPLGYADSPCNLESSTTCLYHWKRGFSISPMLQLYKCDELIDFPEFCVGYIDENGKTVMNELEYEKAVSRKPTDFKNCSACQFLPQCGSGCPIRAMNTKGTPHQEFCEASYESVRRKVASYLRSDEDSQVSNTRIDDAAHN